MKNIRWGWIVLGGFLAEVALIVIAIPVAILAGQASLTYVVPPASFVALLVFGFWIARKAQKHLVLHGALVGLVGVVLYVALTLGRPEPAAYIVAHVLKVLGGATGGYLALDRVTTSAADA